VNETMAPSFTPRWVVGLLACLPLVATCSKDPCFPGSKGKQYRIHIVELWDAGSRFPGGTQARADCPVDFDLKPGTDFTIMVDGFSIEAPGCSCGKGPVVEAPDAWTWQGVWASACLSNFYQLRAEARQGTCSGEVMISIEASRLPTGDALPGQPPVAYLRRRFQQNGSTCGPGRITCTDQFVVEIVEL